MQLFIRGPQRQTEPRPLLSDSRIAWGHLEWAFRIPVGDTIPLQLWWWRCNKGSVEFLAPWVRVDVAVPTAERTALVSLPYGELRIQYHAQRKYDPSHQGIMMAVRILEMEICFPFGPDALWDAFAAMENHRLVARIRVGPPAQPTLTQHYLGRAQTVETLEFARRRTYKWLPRPLDEVSANVDLSPRDAGDWEGHAREARELQRISGRGSMVYVTPRGLDTTKDNNDDDMDNEAWSNGRRVLPVRLRAQDGGLKVQVFNLGGANDVPYAESCYLRWESFVGGTGKLETELTPHLKLTVHYEKVTGDATIQVTQLVLDARNYSQMLRHMGRNQGAKTV